MWSGRTEWKDASTLAKRIGIFSLLLGMLALVGIPLASAASQSNPSFPSVECGGEWHWVHNQTTGQAGTLTITFASGTVAVTSHEWSQNLIHYRYQASGAETLVAASDDVSGGKLVLSHWPICEETTTTTTTTTQPTTTTTQPTTTTTQPTTTTTQPTTTTTQPTTTTTQPTTTTTQPTTTTTQPTTTTTQPTTTTTQPTTTTTQPTTTTTDAGASRVKALGDAESTSSTTVPSSPERLPTTGMNIGDLTALGAALTLFGLLVVATTRQVRVATDERATR
jgi:hypothetical protein